MVTHLLSKNKNSDGEGSQPSLIGVSKTGKQAVSVFWHQPDEDFDGGASEATFIFHLNPAADLGDITSSVQASLSPSGRTLHFIQNGDIYFAVDISTGLLKTQATVLRSSGGMPSSLVLLLGLSDTSALAISQGISLLSFQ